MSSFIFLFKNWRTFLAYFMQINAFLDFCGSFFFLAVILVTMQRQNTLLGALPSNTVIASFPGYICVEQLVAFSMLNFNSYFWLQICSKPHINLLF